VSVKERMIAIRLMEMLQGKPAYAKTIGITVDFAKKQQNDKETRIL